MRWRGLKNRAARLDLGNAKRFDSETFLWGDGPKTSWFVKKNTTRPNPTPWLLAVTGPKDWVCNGHRS